jgi:hypothetical protein
MKATKLLGFDTMPCEDKGQPHVAGVLFVGACPIVGQKEGSFRLLVKSHD